MSPPFLTARFLRVTDVGGSSGEKGSLLSVGLLKVIYSLTRQRAQGFMFRRKTSPPFLAHYCLEGSCVWLCMSRTMDAESKEKNVSPLSGMHLSIFPRVFVFRTFGGRSFFV